jgi:hypothetical protein
MLDINQIGVNNGFGGDLATGNVNIAELQKALTAGDQADPSLMGTGGNTLQVESLEMQLVIALAERVEDFKLMRFQKRNAVGSTVHQYTQETNSGSFEGLGTAELGDPIPSVSEFARITRNVKYFQTQREASLQVANLNPAVGGNAEATEERLGTHVMLKGTEYYCFHGDEDVTPNLPSGYPAMIRKEAPQNVFDMKGVAISEAGGAGKDVIDDAIGAIYEQGGEITDFFFPPTLAKGWMDLIEAGLRYNDSSRIAGTKLTTYQTMYGKDAHISGRAGVDKMYKVKVKPTPSSALLAQKPNAPTITVTPGAKTGGTGFTATTAGVYRYTAYAVEASGLISEAGTPVNATLADGEEGAIVITHDATKPGTGFILCRGKIDDSTSADLREMFKVAKAVGATTSTFDRNDELPGSAEMLLLSSEGVQPSYQWDSFMDMRRVELGRTRASNPFLLIWYGTPDLKVANFNGIIKNIAHRDVVGWYA